MHDYILLPYLKFGKSLLTEETTLTAPCLPTQDGLVATGQELFASGKGWTICKFCLLVFSFQFFIPFTFLLFRHDVDLKFTEL